MEYEIFQYAGEPLALLARSLVPVTLCDLRAPSPRGTVLQAFSRETAQVAPPPRGTRSPPSLQSKGTTTQRDRCDASVQGHHHPREPRNAPAQRAGHRNTEAPCSRPLRDPVRHLRGRRPEEPWSGPLVSAQAGCTTAQRNRVLNLVRDPWAPPPGRIVLKAHPEQPRARFP